MVEGQEIKELPADATGIAEKYAFELNTPLLREPLTVFLQNAARIPSLEAIAIAIWDEPGVPRSLELYAVLDNTGIFDENSPASRAAVAVSEAQGILDRALRTSTSLLSCHLTFVNRDHENLWGVIAPLRESLATDQYLTLGDSVKYLSGWTIARTTRVLA